LIDVRTVSESEGRNSVFERPTLTLTLSRRERGQLSVAAERPDGVRQILPLVIQKDGGCFSLSLRERAGVRVPRKEVF
jgi:hypothetical protein